MKEYYKLIFIGLIFIVSSFYFKFQRIETFDFTKQLLFTSDEGLNHIFWSSISDIMPGFFLFTGLVILFFNRLTNR